MEDELLKKSIAEHAAAVSALGRDAALQKSVAELAEKISACFKSGGRLLVCGNGGSASDAQHMAAELVGRYMRQRRALPAIALTANSSSLTAIGNDYGFERVFARQVEALAEKGDVVLAISTSGNSPSALAALQAARAKGALAAALVGAKPCRLDKVAQISIKAPSESTPRIQEMHALLIHAICEMVEAGF